MRYAYEEDLPAIRAALLRMKQRTKSPHLKDADIEIAMEAVKGFIKQNLIVIQGRYLVIYAVGIPWYGKTRTLIEKLVLRLPYEDDGTIDQVPQMLKDLARFNDCTAILVSDGQSMTYMRRVYEKAGFLPVGVQLYMEC